MSWGRGLFIAFVAFTVFMAALVTVCVREEIGLVSPDYYAQELAFQDQIDRMNNTASLSEVPTIKVANDSVRIAFSDLPKVERATLRLTRPSSAKYDASFEIDATKATSASYSIGHLPHGRYNGSLLWVKDGKEYFVQTHLDL